MREKVQLDGNGQKKSRIVRDKWGLFQVDVLYVDVFVKENLCVFLELFFALGGQVVALSVLGQLLFHFGMTLQIVAQTGCYVLALRHDAHMLRHMESRWAMTMEVRPRMMVSMAGSLRIISSMRFLTK